MRSGSIPQARGNVSAYRRIGVSASRKTAFRHGHNDQEVSTKLMTLCKRRHADTPIRQYVSLLSDRSALLNKKS